VRAEQTCAESAAVWWCGGVVVQVMGMIWTVDVEKQLASEIELEDDVRAV
jgi:hypothetical protein